MQGGDFLAGLKLDFGFGFGFGLGRGFELDFRLGLLLDLGRGLKRGGGSGGEVGLKLPEGGDAAQMFQGGFAKVGFEFHRRCPPPFYF